VTAPLSGGLSIVPPGGAAAGAGFLRRSAWVRLTFGNGTYTWQPARWGSAAAPTLTSPAAEAVGFVAGLGNVLARSNYGSSRWNQDALCLGGQLFDVAALGPYSQPVCLCYRELVAFTRNTTPDASKFLGHGLFNLFDTEVNSGGVVFSGGLVQSFGFLGYGYSPTSGTYFWAKKPRGAVSATFTALAGFDGAVPHTVDHRLFAPTLAAPAVYELRLNGVLITRVLGDDPAFPQPTANNHRFHPIGAASDNYAGISGGIRVMRGDLFICDGSAESLAFL
jgi:hypothetical protein